MLKIVMKNGAGPFTGVDIYDFLDFTMVNVKYPSVKVRELTFFPGFLDDGRFC
jgi:hypothetical protein